MQNQHALICNINHCLHRYMSRCVLLPCTGSSSQVELDVLSEILSNAGAAFPEALKVGNSVLKMKPERLYRIRNRVSSVLGEIIEDSRLLTQYAFYIACVKKVCTLILCITLIIYMCAGYQIIKKVHHSELTKSAMWRYFEKVVAPEIQAHQPSQPQASRPKLEVLLEQLVKKKPPLSKVYTIII